MPLFNSAQGAGPETIDSHLSGSAAEKAALPMVLAVGLRYNVDTWEYNLHDGAGWQTCTDQTEYNPPIRVRKVLINNVQAAYDRLVVCLSGNGETARVPVLTYQMGIDANYATRILHDLHVTKVYLDATYANNLVLFG